MWLAVSETNARRCMVTSWGSCQQLVSVYEGGARIQGGQGRRQPFICLAFWNILIHILKSLSHGHDNSVN